MLKILQARLQQYMNHELPDVQAGFRKGRGTWDQIANIHWIIERQESSRKTSTSALWTTKAFDHVDYNKLWKILKEMEIPDHLTCFLRNLYAGQETTVRTGHGTTDWFQIGKGVRQDCILSPCLFSLHAEYNMQNEGWIKQKVESRLQEEISITSDIQMTPPLWQWRRTEEPLDESERKSEKVGLKLNIQKTKIMASGPITSWQIDENSGRRYFFELQNHSRWWLQPWN